MCVAAASTTQPEPARHFERLETAVAVHSGPPLVLVLRWLLVEHTSKACQVQRIWAIGVGVCARVLVDVNVNG